MPGKQAGAADHGTSGSDSRSRRPQPDGAARRVATPRILARAATPDADRRRARGDRGRGCRLDRGAADASAGAGPSGPTYGQRTECAHVHRTGGRAFRARRVVSHVEGDRLRLSLVGRWHSTMAERFTKPGRPGGGRFRRGHGDIGTARSIPGPRRAQCSADFQEPVRQRDRPVDGQFSGTPASPTAAATAISRPIKPGAAPTAR